MKITDKLLYTDGTKIYDIVGNEVDVLNGLTNSFKYILAYVDGNICSYPIKKVDYNKFSIIINQENGLLFTDVEEIFLNNMRNIEFLCFQYLLRRKMNQRDKNLWEDYLDIVDCVKNGQMNSTEYSEQILKLKNIDERLFNSVQFFSNIEFSNQLMLDELKHGELRLIDCINSQLDNIKEFTEKNEIGVGEELISYSIHTDNAGFCIQDFIKSIYKQLDILSKIMFYTNDLENINKQIPEKHFDNIIKIINSWEKSNEKENSIKLFEELKIFRSIRNEVTHNTSFHTIRQPIFIGNGTECINNIHLLYSDIMFWDYCGNQVERSNGRVGFYKNKTNALSEMQKHFINSIKLNYNCMLHLYEKLMKKLLDCKIESVYIWNEVEGIPKLVEVNSTDLMNQFKDIRFD